MFPAAPIIKKHYPLAPHGDCSATPVIEFVIPWPIAPGVGPPTNCRFWPTQDDHWCRYWLPTEMVVSRIKTFVPVDNCHIQKLFLRKKERNLALCQTRNFGLKRKKRERNTLRSRLDFSKSSISQMYDSMVQEKFHKLWGVFPCHPLSMIFINGMLKRMIRWCRWGLPCGD